MTIGRLRPRDRIQRNLFASVADDEKQRRLMETMDTINRNLSTRNRIHLASAGNGIDNLVRREHDSRLYTMRLSDIIEIHSAPSAETAAKKGN